MSYNQKEWSNRTSEYPNRYKMQSANGNLADVSIVPNEGAVTSEGDKFCAETMNDMETRIANGFSSASSDLATVDADLKARIAAEATRAQGEENLLSQYLGETNTNLANEITRATGIEGGLRTDLDAEVTRSTNADTSFNTRVTSVESRVTDAESDVDTLTSRITGLETSIELEEGRATDAEELLQGNIDSLAGDLADEVARAESAEGVLTTDLANEVTRATGAEGTLQTNLNNLQNYVNEKIAGAYRASGSVYFADLPPLTSNRLGNVYNIKDNFTTTDDFVEGAGKQFPSGTDVAIVNHEQEITVISYEAVTPVGDEDPSVEGWFELETIGTSEEYVLSADTEVVEGKTYYEEIESTETITVIKYDCMAGFIDISQMGHTIQDDSTTFTTRTNLKFENCTVTDDPTNDATVVQPAGSQDAYLTSDTASSTINDTDYVPMHEDNSGTITRKKALWTTLVTKIKSAFSKSDVGLGNVANLDQSKAITSISRSGTTFTATALDGTTSTFTQQDNNTTYAAGTGTTITGTNNAINVTYGNAANTACQGNDSRLSNARTPTSHASTGTGYGVGNASNYGHVKLTDSYSTSSGVAAANSIAASGKAVYDVYSKYCRPFWYNASSGNYGNKRVSQASWISGEIQVHIYGNLVIVHCECSFNSSGAYSSGTLATGLPPTVFSFNRGTGHINANAATVSLTTDQNGYLNIYMEGNSITGTVTMIGQIVYFTTWTS